MRLSITQPIIAGIAAVAMATAGTGTALAATNNLSALAHANAATACTSTPIVLGIHGIYEGPVPSGGVGNSQMLTTFDIDMFKIDSYIKFQYVPYVTPNGWNLKNASPYVEGGASALQSAVTKFISSTCSSARDGSIGLVGYSFGAWVIHDWMAVHPSDLKYLAEVELYGDPCWVKGNDEGLARLFDGGWGCGPWQFYPYPVGSSDSLRSFNMESYSLTRDPVSGVSYNSRYSSTHALGQLKAAAGCILNPNCPHEQYQAGKSGADLVEDGASRMAGYLS